MHDVEIIVKTVNEIFFDTNPKNLEKLNKALGNSNSLQYATAFSQEINNSTSLDFQDFRLFITDSFICSYNFGVLNYEVSILPIGAVNNVYRCNMVQNEYDFDNLYLVAEMNNGQKLVLARVFRNGTKNMHAFDQAVDNIRFRRSRLTYGGNQ